MTILHWLEATVRSDLNGTAVDGDWTHIQSHNSLLRIAWSFITDTSTSYSYLGEDMEVLFCFIVEHCYLCLTQQLRSAVTMVLNSLGRSRSDGRMRHSNEEEESWAGWMDQREHFFGAVKPVTIGSYSWDSEATYDAAAGVTPSSNNAESGNKVETFDDEEDDDVSLLATPHIETSAEEPNQSAEVPNHSAVEPNHPASLDEQEQHHPHTDSLVKQAQNNARRVLGALFSSRSRPHYSVFVCLQECTLHMSSPPPRISIFEISPRKTIRLPTGRYIIFMHNSTDDLHERDLGWFSRTVLEDFIEQLTVYFDDDSIAC